MSQLSSPAHRPLSIPTIPGTVLRGHRRDERHLVDCKGALVGGKVDAVKGNLDEDLPALAGP